MQSLKRTDLEVEFWVMRTYVWSNLARSEAAALFASRLYPQMEVPLWNHGDRVPTASQQDLMTEVPR